MATPPKNWRGRGAHTSASAPASATDPKSRLHACIASLTRSGQTKLDDTLMRELKRLCRTDYQLIDLAYALLTHCLAEAHAQVRYSAFQIVDQLFRRSRRFRCLVLDRFERMVDCVLIDNEAKDPPPKPVSVFRQLGDLALEAFIAWHDQFSGEHPKLVFAFRYLSEAHSARLRQVRVRLAQSEAARQSAARQLAAKKRELLADTRRQLGEDESELSACLATVANCLALLVPSPEEFDINRLTSDGIGEIADFDAPDDDAASTTADDEEDLDEQRRLHGIVGRPGASQSVVSLRLCRPCLRQTADNAELIEALVTRTEQLRRRMRPRLARWLAVVERCAYNPVGNVDASAAVEEDEGLRPRLTELLAEADRLLSQVAQLQIIRGGEATDATATGAAAEVDDDESITHDGSDDDDDFEPVNKEGFETEVAAPAASTSKAVVRSPPSTISKAASKSTSAAAPSSSTELALKPVEPDANAYIPVVPFGIDLANWGSAEIPTIGYRPDDGGHAFGYRPPDGDAEFEIQGSRDMLTMRTMVFQTSDEPPTSRTCRHPLPDGAGLCERMDRVKCPFHGRIVPRDESGRPEGVLTAAAADPSPPPAETKKEKRRRKSVGAAEKSATGGVGTSGLVDIRALEDNSRSRLASRVASKAALRRVEAAESARRRRKMAEKFGDHFQYQFMN